MDIGIQAFTFGEGTEHTEVLRQHWKRKPAPGGEGERMGRDGSMSRETQKTSEVLAALVAQDHEREPNQEGGGGRC